MTQPQIGQLYQRNSNPNKIIMVTGIHQAHKQVMTKAMSPNTRDGWRSVLGLQVSWTPITQERK